MLLFHKYLCKLGIILHLEHDLLSSYELYTPILLS